MPLSTFRYAKLCYLFRLMDLDKDEVLSQEDFDEMARRASENQDKSREGELHKRIISSSATRYYKRLLDALEITGSQIKLADWLDFFRQLDDEDDVEMESVIQFFLEFFYGVFDVDKDGFISLYESMELFQLFGLPLQKSKTFFKDLDSNADGHVSRYELMNAVEVFLTSDDPEERGNWIFGEFDY